MSELVAATCDKIKIHVLSDGEQWCLSGEVRLADSEDVRQFREWGVKKGQIISVLDNGDFEISSEQWAIEVTADEFKEIKEGAYPRHMDGYYDRLENIGPLTFEKWVRRYLPIKGENDEPKVFELEELKKNEPSENEVWTLVQGEEGGLVILAGYHFVNRLGYYITKTSFTAEDRDNLFVMLDNICSEDDDVEEEDEEEDDK